MEWMEVGRDDMDKGEVVWAEQDDAEAEGGRGGVGRGTVGTGIHRAPESGCRDRRHNPR